MHRKAVFFLAGIFLAVALIVPIMALVTTNDSDLDNYVNQYPSASHATRSQRYPY